VISTPPDPLDFRSVRHAYDTVAEDYATYLPDTRAEAFLDLAMIDAFAQAVTSGDDAHVLDGGCGAGRMSRYLAERGLTCLRAWSPWHDATTATWCSP
jgi:cyclopropane fatty-acyl-phospholipid synthase-like methyltransferase